jgi:TPR repeat protein
VANAQGVIQLPDGQKLVDFQREEEKQRSDRLRAAAAGGFAQACGQIGQDYQKAKEDKKAYEWFAKAAKLGLASGMKDQGFLLFSGRGVERDAEEGLKITRQAADRGDVFAILNMAAFYARGLGVDKDQETARQWLDKAVKSGNYWGRLENSLALATGRYGSKPDKKAAVQEMGRALETRNREVLEVLASWYAEGEVVDADWGKAVELAEAAFVQGSTQAAPLLAQMYGKGGGGLKKDEKLAEYWKIQANASLAFVLETVESHPEIAKRLKQLDPWAIKLD